MSRLSAGAIVRSMVASTTVAVAAVSHIGWWLDWQTRSRVGQGCRALED